MRRWHKLLAQTLRNLSFAPAGRTRSVYILGMHRSGTSALTGVLADHGLHLVDAVERDHVDASASNPAGNLEDRRVPLGTLGSDQRNVLIQRYKIE
jgi:hypothetical protein